MRPGTSRARARRSSGSRRRAAASSSGVASLPRLEANASWARSRSIRARCNSSSGPVARDGEQAARGVEAPGLHVGEGGGERALDPRRRIGRQLGRAGQERGGGGEASASLRAAGRALELGGDLLVGPGVARARCQARRSGSRVGVGGLGEGAMHAVAVVGGGRAVGGGPDERVRELDASARSGAARRPPPGRPRPCRCRASRRRGGAAPGRRAAPRPRRARAAGCRAGAAGGAGRSSARSCRPPAGCRAARTRRRDRRPSRCAAARAARAGCRGSRR